MKKFLVYVALVITLICFAYMILYCYVLYPVKYSDIISEYSLQYGVDMELVFATINVESGFDKNAKSKVGACGLMQVLPSTAEEIAYRLDIENFSAEMLFDVELNINLGCYYLAYLIDYYNGVVTNAICAYNAGLSNVNLWLLDSEYSTNGIITSTPFNETTNYLIKMNKNIKIYKSRLS